MWNSIKTEKRNYHQCELKRDLRCLFYAVWPDVLQVYHQLVFCLVCDIMARPENDPTLASWKGGVSPPNLGEWDILRPVNWFLSCVCIAMAGQQSDKMAFFCRAFHVNKRRFEFNLRRRHIMGRTHATLKPTTQTTWHSLHRVTPAAESKPQPGFTSSAVPAELICSIC